MASVTVNPESRLTATDLSAAVNSFKFCKLSADRTIVLCTTLGEKSHGILEYAKADPTGPASVWPLSRGGTAKITLGATLAAGAEVTTSAAAVAVAAASGHRVLGQLVVGGISGDVVEISIFDGRIVP